VCAGLAAHLRIATFWVRIGFVVLATTGLGALLYPAAWWLMPTETRPAPARRFRARDTLDFAAYGLIALGIAELFRVAFGSLPWWVGLPIAAAIAALVVVVAVARSSGAGTPSTASEFVDALRTRPGRITRATTGALLALAGAAALIGTNNGWAALRNGMLALGVLFSGLALLLAPWLWRLSTELIDERRERLRSEERADISAHLHDSVLQTLAMVQRRAHDPEEVVRLARRQERELRDWLRSGQSARPSMTGTLGEALAASAAELEDLHGVVVEVVQVRDCPLTDRGMALVQAAREAIANAQRHAGVSSVSVFCEVDDDGSKVYVRDRGIGFDRARVPDDRRGLTESIEQRMARYGGVAIVRSVIGTGTEVELAMPLRDPA
jgi:signal transduction histidine kinase